MRACAGTKAPKSCWNPSKINEAGWSLARRLTTVSSHTGQTSPGRQKVW